MLKSNVEKQDPRVLRESQKIVPTLKLVDENNDWPPRQINKNVFEVPDVQYRQRNSNVYDVPDDLKPMASLTDNEDRKQRLQSERASTP